MLWISSNWTFKPLRLMLLIPFLVSIWPLKNPQLQLKKPLLRLLVHWPPLLLLAFRVCVAPRSSLSSTLSEDTRGLKNLFLETAAKGGRSWKIAYGVGHQLNGVLT